MNTVVYEKFMELARRHTEAHTAATNDSDLYIGLQMGLEYGMQALAAGDPEVFNDPAVQSVLQRLENSMSALPLSVLNEIP